VAGHQLLLLANRVEKAERVHAEADHPHHGHSHQRCSCAERHLQPLARAGRREHQEWERQPRGHLDPHTDRQRARTGTKSRAGSSG